LIFNNRTIKAALDQKIMDYVEYIIENSLVKHGAVGGYAEFKHVGFDKCTWYV
jgi:hypothetical protein